MSAPRPTPADDQVPPPPEGSASRGLWVAIWALLAPAVVLPLLVGIYDRTDPELAGFPFYFWFQFALIPVAAVLTLAAFALSRRADARDRAARAARPGRGGR
ncbi:DUF3311 domain-containing protein [Nocardioides marmoribigeumensis]|jgi:hypothetical protein|uniref:DUF3311 domain-containing protein n=1 Tax=Nocardioides marmoribigeumensis TaxID=433649 RepID=A0ABU2BUE2_9ACTN|nr:DUF3311 domain-containing protein [Nocardioides marmoribigeumensis]MDR7362247.1 hypothetical protein [Nocardioides marmoribigeumensis]